LALCPAPLLAADKDKARPADNWPNWRGPLHGGAAPKAKPPLTWDAKTNVAWKTAIPGRGSASPIVWGDQAFVLTAIDTGNTAHPKDIPHPDERFKDKKKTTATNTWHQFVVMAIDRNTGKVKWQKTCAERVPHEGHHFTHSYAAGSPVTDGERLIVS